MLYIPVCICLRSAHGMHLAFLSVTIKVYNFRGQMCVLIFFFRDNRRASLNGWLAMFNDFQIR